MLKWEKNVRFINYKVKRRVGYVVKLEGKVAIITGGASGIGKAVVGLFSAEGATVILADLPGSEGAEVADALQKKGREVHFIPADVAEESQVQNLIDQTINSYGKIDIMYNNAGISMEFTPIEETSTALYEKMLGINMTGIFFGCKAVIPHMKKVGSGVILMTGSTGAVRPRPHVAIYNASKGAVVAFSKTLAVELAPFGIRVNCINPSATNTAMLSESHRQEFIKNIPLGRVADPIDVAQAALFLVSDESRMITGVDLSVDGGRCV